MKWQAVMKYFFFALFLILQKKLEQFMMKKEISEKHLMFIDF